jgi:hypothetical protein
MSEIAARSSNCQIVGASAGLPACLHLEDSGARTAHRRRVEACCHAARHANNPEADAGRKTLQRGHRDSVVPGIPSHDRQARRICRKAEVLGRIDPQPVALWMSEELGAVIVAVDEVVATFSVEVPADHIARRSQRACPGCTRHNCDALLETQEGFAPLAWECADPKESRELMHSGGDRVLA